MDVVVVFVGFAVLTAVLAGGTFLAARHAAGRVHRIEAECATREAVTGVCGACVGEGITYEPRGGQPHVSGRFEPCWRCHGTGRPPPPPSTAID